MEEMRKLRQWVAWREEVIDGRVTKIPYNPKTGKAARVNSPSTWGTYEEAMSCGWAAGPGFVFTPDDVYCGIDVDKMEGRWCVSLLVEYFDSYAEFSPSGNGIHILVKGRLNAPGNRAVLPCGIKIEIYDKFRFFTVTGLRLPSAKTTVESRQERLDALHQALFNKDCEVIRRACERDRKFALLWAGNWQEAGYPSQSEADLALATKIALWCGPDPEKVDRLFRMSGLARGKWERDDYRQRTLEKALEKLPPGKGIGIVTVTAAQLQDMVFDEQIWAVPSLLPEGLCMLSARPKKGKTWLALGLSVAKATGGCALTSRSFVPNKSKVLYMALEDGLRRLQQRLNTLLAGTKFPDNLIVTENWGRLDLGGLEALRDFISTNGDCELVVIDSYAKVKPPKPKHVDSYEFDMAWGGALAGLAREFRICILLVYHNRKSEGVDPLDDVLGSTGLTGAADAVMVLRRGRGQVDGTLLITGRDVEEKELALKFRPDEGVWEYLGDSREYKLSKEKGEIVDLLKAHGPLTPSEMARMLDRNRSRVKLLVWRMAKAGELLLTSKGKYKLNE